jgi:hypothetical protein
MLISQDEKQMISNGPSKYQCTQALEQAVEALELLDDGNTIVSRCHEYLQRLLVAAHTLPGDLHWQQANIDEDGSLLHPTSSAHEQPTLDDCNTSTFSAEAAGTISGPESWLSLPPEPPLLDSNVGNLMMEGDLEFLDFYFAQQSNYPAGSQATL